jgi:hypothetical protein
MSFEALETKFAALKTIFEHSKRVFEAGLKRVTAWVSQDPRRRVSSDPGRRGSRQTHAGVSPDPRLGLRRCGCGSLANRQWVSGLCRTMVILIGLTRVELVFVVILD